MEPREHWGTGALVPPDPEEDREPCPECGDGDKVPAKGHWICPKCDAEWGDDSDD
jgi:hypothetical protein